MFLRLTDLIGREKKISRNKNRSTERSISSVFQSYKGIEDLCSIINSIVILNRRIREKIPFLLFASGPIISP